MLQKLNIFECHLFININVYLLRKVKVYTKFSLLVFGQGLQKVYIFTLPWVCKEWLTSNGLVLLVK